MIGVKFRRNKLLTFLCITFLFILFYCYLTFESSSIEMCHQHIRQQPVDGKESFDARIIFVNEFKLNPKEKVCQSSLSSEQSLLFISFVILAPHNFERRALIRSTWGAKNISSDFKLIFTIGMSQNKTINDLVEKESLLNQDILQIDNFVDDYHNMTIKIMKSLKWIHTHCSNAKYILRINDDVVVNTRRLVEHFKKINYATNTIYGHLFQGETPVRDENSKFYVSKQEFPCALYDDYVEGMHL